MTSLGGPTSHTSIIARQLGIPCIVAAEGIEAIAAGTHVLVDGTAVCEEPLTGPVHCTPHPLFIGKKGPFGYTFDGDLDELEVK